MYQSGKLDRCKILRYHTLIVRHRVADNRNFLPLLLQIVCNKASSLALTRASSCSTDSYDRLWGLELGKLGWKLNEFASGSIYSSRERLDGVIVKVAVRQSAHSCVKLLDEWFKFVFTEYNAGENNAKAKVHSQTYRNDISLTCRSLIHWGIGFHSCHCCITRQERVSRRYQAVNMEEFE